MDENELLRFLDELFKNNTTEGARLSMEQLCQILDRTGENRTLVETVRSFIKYGKEMQDMSHELHNRQLTEEDMNIAIQRGKRREQEEYEARNRGRC